MTVQSVERETWGTCHPAKLHRALPFSSLSIAVDGRRFHHLVGYGATYFSYSYAQALSSAIWQQYFPDGRMSRASGQYAPLFLLWPYLFASFQTAQCASAYNWARALRNQLQSRVDLLPTCRSCH